MTNISTLKLSGAVHWVKTSRMRFWAFSYSIGDPCERSFQVMTYFIGVLLRSWRASLTGSAEMARPPWQGACRAGPAHGEDSLCRGYFLLNQPALQRIEGGSRPGGDTDLGVKALD